MTRPTSYAPIVLAAGVMLTLWGAVVIVEESLGSGARSRRSGRWVVQTRFSAGQIIPEDRPVSVLPEGSLLVSKTRGCAYATNGF